MHTRMRISSGLCILLHNSFNCHSSVIYLYCMLRVTLEEHSDILFVSPTRRVLIFAKFEEAQSPLPLQAAFTSLIADANMATPEAATPSPVHWPPAPTGANAVTFERSRIARALVARRQRQPSMCVFNRVSHMI